MKMMTLMKAAITAMALFLSTASHAAGLLKPIDSRLTNLEIRTHHVDVTIQDGYVTTSVEQTFYNPNDSALEAIYSFPVPESAAVGEFIYWINDQPIVGEVVEKEKAKEIYEEQKALGRHAALVEKDKYKTFDIHVFPVQAMSEVKIRLVYIQPSYVDTSIGRYVYPLEEGGVDEEKRAFWSRNEIVSEIFSFNLNFRSSYPIDALRLPQHSDAQVQKISENEWQVELVNQTNSEQGTSNQNVITLSQDIVVYWRQKTGLPGSVDLITYKAEENKRGTFMLTLTPGEDLSAITLGTDWVFVLDVSGSMQGKYATLIEGVKQGLGKLRQHDRFKVILFNDNAVNLNSGFQAANHTNINTVLHQLDTYQIGGGTNLYAGLDLALHKIDTDRPTGIVLVTDGVANVGLTEKRDFLKLLQSHDVRLFTFIMGNSANRPLLKEMTSLSNGFAQSVSNSDDIVGQILLATSKLTHQAFRNIELNIDGVNVRNLTPEKIHSLYRGEQLIIFGQYWEHGTADITLKAQIGPSEKIYRTTVEFPEKSLGNPEIERLWALASIEHLQSKLDYLGDDADTKKAITDIALEYGLVTQYTSMIVLEEKVFETLTINRQNKRRVDAEQKARENRKTQAIESNRVDEHTPMFNAPRPSYSGSGGAGTVGPTWLIFILILIIGSITQIHSRR